MPGQHWQHNDITSKNLQNGVPIPPPPHSSQLRPGSLSILIYCVSHALFVLGHKELRISIGINAANWDFPLGDPKQDPELFPVGLLSTPAIQAVHRTGNTLKPGPIKQSTENTSEPSQSPAHVSQSPGPDERQLRRGCLFMG